jgi:hypothetical protein
MRDALALGGGPYHFSHRSSRIAHASRIASASSFLGFSIHRYSMALDFGCLRSFAVIWSTAERRGRGR